MTESDRALLLELRQRLLQLHKTLIDWQRAEYERVHGRLQTTQLLNVMFNAAEFQWLRSMSGLIVRIDESLDPPSRPAAATARPRLSSPDDHRAEAGIKLSKAELQKHVDATWTQRSRLQKQIAELGTQRQAFVDAELLKSAVDPSKSFDVVLRGAIRTQARAKGLQFPEESQPVTPEPLAKVRDDC